MRAPRRQRKPILPFGDMMLPVLGLIALGILVFGIRVFFLPEEHDPYKLYVQQESASEKSSPYSVYQEKPQTPPISTPQEFGGTIQESDDTIEGVVAAPVGAPLPTPQVITPKQPKPAPEKPQTARRPAQPKPQPKPKKPSVTGTPSASSGPWVVQIGAFQQKKMAMELISTIRGKGYKPVLGEGLVSGVKYYKVWLPGGGTRESAMMIGEKLARLGYEYFVFPKR
ncbi:MAG: hypothetical protein CSA35_03460 [Dethiosulfovibrio peptidovorans]|nr:MAG: hypothetical protein CSA35_03460 [Dethiosulfovibrio peptidovorans]